MRARRGQRGSTLAGLTVSLAGAALLLTLAAGALAPAAGRRAAESAARALAARIAALEVRAVSEGRETGLVFGPGADEPWCEAADADGDGLSRSGVTNGTDASGPALRVAADVSGTRIGRPPWPSIAEVPPAGGRILAGDPAVRFGRARMAVFDPEGHATPGTVFVTDGRDALCAVVVAGATGRVRVWCYAREEDAWRLR